MLGLYGLGFRSSRDMGILGGYIGTMEKKWKLL